jgi:uncharacterized membrane protein (UPF0127 family)
MSIRINNITFPAEYLSEPEDLQRGMMGRDNLDGCMVFKMGKGFHSFHMMSCKIPLDIVFINNGRISRIHSNCQPCNGKCSQKFTGIGDHVIEFPAGTASKFKNGDRVMYLGSPLNPIA